MAVPIAALAVGAVALGLAGYALLGSSGAKGKTAPVPTTTTKDGKEVPTIDLKTTKGYFDGFNAGHADGYADAIAGLPSNPRPELGYSANATEQAAHDLGYDAGYAEGRDAGLAFKAFTTDSTGAVDDTKTDVAKEKEKVGTEKQAKDARAAGMSDGRYAALQDYAENHHAIAASSSSRYHNLRNAVAGMPRSDAYKAGYVEGLDTGYANGGVEAESTGGGADSGHDDAVDVGHAAHVERMVERGHGLTGVGFLDRRIGVGQTTARARYSRPSLMADTRTRGGVSAGAMPWSSEKSKRKLGGTPVLFPSQPLTIGVRNEIAGGDTIGGQAFSDTPPAPYLYVNRRRDPLRDADDQADHPMAGTAQNYAPHDPRRRHA